MKSRKLYIILTVFAGLMSGCSSLSGPANPPLLSAADIEKNIHVSVTPIEDPLSEEELVAAVVEPQQR